MKDLYIRAITREDSGDVVRWRNDPNVRKNLFSQTELSVKQHLEYYRCNIETGKCHQFIIVAEGNPVGTTFLKNIDPDAKSAEFGIFIGESSARGKGYASRVTRMVIDYGFSMLKLKKIVLSVFADNVPAIKAYKRAGFVIDRVYDSFECEGETINVIVMSISDKVWKDQI